MADDKTTDKPAAPKAAASKTTTKKTSAKSAAPVNKVEQPKADQPKTVAQKMPKAASAATAKAGAVSRVGGGGRPFGLHLLDAVPGSPFYRCGKKAGQ